MGRAGKIHFAPAEFHSIMVRVTKTLVLLLAAWHLAALGLKADITDSAASGFTVTVITDVHAAPHEVYQKLLRPADWWDSAHTFSRDARNLYLEPKPAGCFCERMPDGGGVRHLEVLTVIPDKMLVMSGGLGPMQFLALAGIMRIDLAPSNDGTKLTTTYAVSGYLKNGVNTWADPSNQVLTQQMTRLKNLLEQGSPAPATK